MVELKRERSIITLHFTRLVKWVGFNCLNSFFNQLREFTMQWLAAISVKRPVFASVLILSLTIVGAFAFTQLGVDRFPKVDFPTVVVTTRLPGAAPEEVETEITDKIEERIVTVGETVGQQVEITSGLHEEDTVAVSPKGRLSDGLEVRTRHASH